MNKQELINKLKKNTTKVSQLSSEGFGFYDGLKLGETIKLVEQLDEPEMPVVPKEFDKWYQEIIARYLKSDGAKRFALWKICQFGFGHGFEDVAGERTSDSLSDWVCLHKKEAMNAILNGYEIEKEKLWVVPLPSINMNGFPAYLYKQDGTHEVVDNCDSEETRFTQAELEKVPSPYRKFAVPAENE